MEKKRSVGVAVLGYVIIISNTILLFKFVPAVNIFISPILSKVVGIFTIFPFALFMFISFQNFVVYPALTIIFEVASIICGYGVIRLKNIARIICIVSSLIRIIATGFLMVYFSELLNPFLIAAIVLLSIYIFFLRRPKVKEQFK